MYCDSGNSIHFSFFTTQFFPASLKMTIPKQYKKEKQFFLNINHREKLCFTELVQEFIEIEACIAASGLLFLFAQPNKFYKFH